MKKTIFKSQRYAQSLNIQCPTCLAAVGKPCRTAHAINESKGEWREVVGSAAHWLRVPGNLDARKGGVVPERFTAYGLAVM